MAIDLETTLQFNPENPNIFIFLDESGKL